MTKFFSDGWAILSHSIFMLHRNLMDALKLSIGPIVIGILVVVAMTVVSGGSLSLLLAIVSGGEVPEELPLTVVLGVLFSLLIALFVMSWIAVAWHRFVLREEYPALLPALSDRPVLPYMGRSIMLSLLLGVLLIPISALVGLAAMGLFFLPNSITSVLATFVSGTFLSYLWLRFSFVLPAISIGTSIGLRQAWQLTAPHAQKILGASVVFMLMTSVLQLVASIVVGIPGVGLVLDVALTWWLMFVGLGLLTTLYGVIAEGRDLPAH